MKESYSPDKFRKGADELPDGDQKMHDELMARDPKALELHEREFSKTPGMKGVSERFSASWDIMFRPVAEPLGSEFFTLKLLHSKYLNETKPGQLELAQKEAETLNKEYDRLKDNMVKAVEEYKSFLEEHIDPADETPIANAA